MIGAKILCETVWPMGWEAAQGEAPEAAWGGGGDFRAHVPRARQPGLSAGKGLPMQHPWGPVGAQAGGEGWKQLPKDPVSIPARAGDGSAGLLSIPRNPPAGLRGQLGTFQHPHPQHPSISPTQQLPADEFWGSAPAASTTNTCSWGRAGGRKQDGQQQGWFPFSLQLCGLFAGPS